MMCRFLMIACLSLPMLLGGCVSDLGRAARDGDMSTVRSLLEQGVTQEDKDDALSRAPISHRSEIVQVLLEKGANINNSDGLPLLNAVGMASTEIVRILLERGADPNLSRGYYGMTPLWVAAYRGYVPITQLLLAHGAVTGIADLKGRTPLKIAEEKGHTAVAQLLRQAEARELGLAQSSATAPQVAAVPPIPPVPSVPSSDVDRVPSFRATPNKHAYAVVIGIEQYREQLPKANFAAHDASVVGDYVTKVLGYPEENVVVRLNEKATKTDLEKYFEGWLPNNVEKDSSVFVYFSGHGSPHVKTGDAYLVPYDGDPTFVDKTGYSLKRLYAALDKLPAKDVTVVLDSCFSGAGGRSVLAEGARPMGLSMETQALPAGRITVLSASSGDQISNTFKEQGHGLLTYFFLKGLQGEGDGNKDGSIEMVELLDYVKPNVQRVARKQYNNEQTPQLLAIPDVLKKGGGRLLERVRP